MVTATGNLMTDLALDLARDVYDARATVNVAPQQVGATLSVTSFVFPLKPACPRVYDRAARGAIVRCVARAAPAAGCAGCAAA